MVDEKADEGVVDGASSVHLLTVSTADQITILAASDQWTAPNAASLDGSISAVLARPSLGNVTLDMSGIERIDTYGAWEISRLQRELSARGGKLKISALPEQYAGLFRAVEQAAELADKVPSQPRKEFTGLAAIGQGMANYGRGFVLLLNMIGAVCAAAFRAILKPSTFRFTSTVHQLDRVGWQAIPIIFLITFLIGSIIAQQGFFHFRKFGADDYVVDMVGILVLREIGVLIVAIMVAGRSGSSYTAELGSMKMREEIDALRTMGFDPVDVLILPRIVALVIALPLLTFIGSMSALYGGELVAWLYGGMSPEIYVARLKEAISMTHFKVGMIKAPFMAFVIGIVACTEGLKVGGSAESLGLRTTASVVTSIFLVIVLDGLFAVFFASIGM
ncbi:MULTISPECIES: MlaE family lipid ABC transporter permease subunit [unclassified Hyphomicrobium]|uniref:MlaE family lipid ABC transporter permease subunit n=1 Tax=unclassified Hyphomicrobium TaxID=2619925 RepID=UPI000213E492|nr:MULTISPECIES: MlaE family lipid ABC transporter permease subunit [unclassified Hyphomicrobium]CCB67705.1 Putative ABC transporter, permease [Hyphomicrobium sp. MC1]